MKEVRDITRLTFREPHECFFEGGQEPVIEPPLDWDDGIFDERNYALVGRHTRKTYQLGDRITVKSGGRFTIDNE